MKNGRNTSTSLCLVIALLVGGLNLPLEGQTQRTERLASLGELWAAAAELTGLMEEFAGVRAGRDEVLEAAVEYALGLVDDWRREDGWDTSLILGR